MSWKTWKGHGKSYGGHGIWRAQKSTNPSQAHYSTLHPLFSRATSHVTTPLVQRKSYVTLRFLLLRNVSLSPVLFAVILVLLWVPKCCNWNCRARRKVSIVFVMDQLISKKLSLSPPKRRSLILSLVSIKLGSCMIRFVSHASSKNPLVSHSYLGH